MESAYKDVRPCIFQALKAKLRRVIVKSGVSRNPNCALLLLFRPALESSPRSAGTLLEAIVSGDDEDRSHL